MPPCLQAVSDFVFFFFCRGDGRLPNQQLGVHSGWDPEGLAGESTGWVLDYGGEFGAGVAGDFALAEGADLGEGEVRAEPFPPLV